MGYKRIGMGSFHSLLRGLNIVSCAYMAAACALPHPTIHIFGETRSLSVTRSIWMDSHQTDHSLLSIITPFPWDQMIWGVEYVRTPYAWRPILYQAQGRRHDDVAISPLGYLWRWNASHLDIRMRPELCHSWLMHIFETPTSMSVSDTPPSASQSLYVKHERHCVVF